MPQYTLEDYKRWEGKWELIHGIPYAMSPTPNRKHQGLASAIGAQLYLLLEDCDECTAFQPIDIIVANDTVLQPDLCILCGEEIE